MAAFSLGNDPLLRVLLLRAHQLVQAVEAEPISFLPRYSHVLHSCRGVVRVARFVCAGGRSPLGEPLCLKCLISVPNLRVILFIRANWSILLIWTAVFLVLVTSRVSLLNFVILMGGALKREYLCLKLALLHIAVCNQVESHLGFLRSFLKLILALPRRFLSS